MKVTDRVLIRVEDLNKSFKIKNDTLHVLKGINEEIHEGEVVSIIGPSGSGKSTFLRCLNLLEVPNSGKVFFEDVEITEKALVKLNRSEVDEIKRAKGKGLLDIYTDDGYVYYTDGEWHGFDNDYPDNTYSYLPCPVHTQEAFEKMDEEKRLEEEKKKQEEEEKKRQEEEEKKRQEEEAAKATEPAAQGE